MINIHYTVAVLGFCVWGANGAGIFDLGLMGIKCRSRETAIAERKKRLTTSVVSSPIGVGRRAPEIDAILNISSENGVHFGSC